MGGGERARVQYRPPRGARELGDHGAGPGPRAERPQRLLSREVRCHPRPRDRRTPGPCLPDRTHGPRQRPDGVRRARCDRDGARRARHSARTRRPAGRCGISRTRSAAVTARNITTMANRVKGLEQFDLIVRSGRVIDPAQAIDGVHDVAVKDGTIARVAPRVAGTAARTVDARNRLVIPGMIDTHSHIYQHVTGDFGMNPDEVGVRSGVTAVVDQGGAAPLTIQGFRKFIKDPAATRVYAFVSNYLVGGLLGHRHVGLYGPHGINVRETIDAIETNRDFVKGIKSHAEVGGYLCWGIETLRFGERATSDMIVTVLVLLGRCWRGG